MAYDTGIAEQILHKGADHDERPKKKRRLAFAAALLAAGAAVAGRDRLRLGTEHHVFPQPQRRRRQTWSIPAWPSAWAGWWKQAACNTAQAREVRFRVTDGKSSVPADFNGVLPALFREGQGVVATGAHGRERHLCRHRSAGQA